MIDMCALPGLRIKLQDRTFLPPCLQTTVNLCDARSQHHDVRAKHYSKIVIIQEMREKLWERSKLLIVPLMIEKHRGYK
jgi:hypothetical protein